MDLGPGGSVLPQDGRRVRLYLHLRPGGYNDECLIEFIRQLRRQFRGQPVLRRRQSLNSHHSWRLWRRLLQSDSAEPHPSLQ